MNGLRNRWLFGLCLISVPAVAEVTYTRNVAPILYQRCVACHHPNDVAPMTLITYSQVMPWAASIREAVLMHKMPLWKADPHYGKWSHSSSGRLGLGSADQPVTIKASAKLRGGPLGGFVGAPAATAATPVSTPATPVAAVARGDEFVGAAGGATLDFQIHCAPASGGDTAADSETNRPAQQHVSDSGRGSGSGGCTIAGRQWQCC